MTNSMKLGLSLLVVFMITVAGFAAYIISAKFTAAKYEQSVFTQNKSMQSTWSMMEQTLKMQGFTVEKYGKDFIATLEANAKRYENDKGGMMKWVQEAQSQMSDKAYLTFMNTIEKVYAKKEAKQLSKDSISEEYGKFLEGSVKGAIASGFFNYPTEKAQTIMDRVIKTKETEKTWETGIEETSTNPFKG